MPEPKDLDFLLQQIERLQLIEQVNEQADDQERNGILLDDYFCQNAIQEESACSGDKVMTSIFETLSKFDPQPTYAQRRFIEMFLMSCLPTIYKSEFDIDRVRIIAKYQRYLDEYSEGEFNPNAIVCTPRQWGKTTGVSMLLAAMLFSVPACKIACFSTSQRASNNVKENVMKFLMQIPAVRKYRMLMKNSVETLALSQNCDPDDPNMSYLLLFPDSPDKLRGQQPNIIFVEEAAFISFNLWSNVCVPLMSVEGRSVLAISSVPTDQSVYYDRLFNLKNPRGKSLFAKYRVKLLCSTCRQTNQSVCDHQLFTKPPWKTDERQELVKIILADADDSFRREIMGESIDNSLAIYPSAQIEKLRLAPTLTFSNTVRFLFIGVDCSGGGLSETSFVAMTYEEQKENSSRVVVSYIMPLVV